MRAVRGIGKYRLSPEFSSFYLDPAIWVQWSEERRNQYFKAFIQSAQAPMTYKKPNLAGRKPRKRRAGNDANAWQVGYYKIIKL